VNANLMQLCNFIDIFLARHVSATYAHRQEHYMSSCSVWFSAPSFWKGGGLESRCVGRVYGADGAGTRKQEVLGVVWCILSSTCFGIRPSSEALDVELQRMVLCTEFVDGPLRRSHQTHDLRSGSQDHHPSRNSVQKTICCNSTCNAPDDGCMYPKYIERRIYQ